jgi:hypothetical protein
VGNANEQIVRLVVLHNLDNLRNLEKRAAMYDFAVQRHSAGAGCKAKLVVLETEIGLLVLVCQIAGTRASVVIFRRLGFICMGTLDMGIQCPNAGGSIATQRKKASPEYTVLFRPTLRQFSILGGSPQPGSPQKN